MPGWRPVRLNEAHSPVARPFVVAEVASMEAKSDVVDASMQRFAWVAPLLPGVVSWPQASIVVVVTAGTAAPAGGLSVITRPLGAPGIPVRNATGSVSKTAGTSFVADTRT